MAKTRRIIPALEDVRPPAYSSKSSVGRKFRMLSFEFKQGQFVDETTHQPKQYAHMHCVTLDTETPEEVLVTAGGDVILRQLAAMSNDALPVEFIFRKSGQQIYMDEL